MLWIIDQGDKKGRRMSITKRTTKVSYLIIVLSCLSDLSNRKSWIINIGLLTFYYTIETTKGRQFLNLIHIVGCIQIRFNI